MDSAPPVTRTVRAAVLPALAALALVAGHVTAQATSLAGGPTLQQATGLLQQQQYAEAVEMLEQITAAQGENPTAWGMLGFALLQTGDLERAADALSTAAELPGASPNVLYNLGLVHARAGNADAAFEALARAKATGQVETTRIALDPNAAGLRADPRWASLFPSPEELSHPFAEAVEILQEWVGEAAGDQFGWIARNIGDVDGDGVHDVTTSAPSHAQNAGKVYVYSSATGQKLWDHTGRPGEQLGLGIEAAGDVNADGVPDVVAGAPSGDRAVVLSGRDGAVLLEIPAPEPGEAFGGMVGDVGDVDGDGHDDILVGAAQNDAAGQDAGRAYVLSGRDGSLLLSIDGERAGDAFGSAGGGMTRNGEMILAVGAPNAGPNNGGRTYVYRGLSTEPAFVVESDETGAQLGAMFVSVVGDVDADGVPDVYASDWANGASGASTGRVYVHSGATGERLYTFTGEAAGDGFGIGEADAGDVDADGHDDLVIGAWQHASLAPSGGKTYLYSGRDGSLLWAITGRVMGETFGFDTTGLGDVDGDGAVDLLLTSAWSAVEGARSGRMFIVSGRPPGGG